MFSFIRFELSSKLLRFFLKVLVILIPDFEKGILKNPSYKFENFLIRFFKLVIMGNFSFFCSFLSSFYGNYLSSKETLEIN